MKEMNTSCLLLFALLPFVFTTEWKDGSPNTRWSMGCDFFGNDLTNVKTSGESCGQKCSDNPSCTHFTWTNSEGGTCWLKQGPVNEGNAKVKNDEGAVCGYLTGRNTGGGGGSEAMFQPGAKGRKTVEDTVSDIERRLSFNSHGMLLRMALIESDFGTHQDAFNTNFIDHTGLHSIGIWQITKMCLDESKTNPNLQEERNRINSAYNINWSQVEMQDMQKPLHSCLAAILYMKFAEKAWPNEAPTDWPSDLQGQAKKWKNHFNRNPGGLSIDGFIKKCTDNGLG